MTRRALFVGIDDYPFEPLTSCVRDAVAMRHALCTLQMLDPSECTLMTFPASDGGAGIPTREAILDWLLAVYDASEPLDRLFVYLSGHGLSVRLGRAADKLQTVFVPAGVPCLANSGSRLIDLDELVGRFTRRGAREQFWIVDACRNLPEAPLEVSTIGWDRPQPGDPREATLQGQCVVYAVSPLAKATAKKGQHGYLTQHLLDGLSCDGAASWGAAATYDEREGGWVIDAQSLVDYASRRIAEELPPNDWQRQYKLPRVWFGEERPGLLRTIGALEDRPFSVSIEPPAAAPAVTVSLSIKRFPVASWPPTTNGQKVPLPPERYRIAARLNTQDGEWSLPVIDDPVVDVRETDICRVRLTPRIPPPPAFGAVPAEAAPAGSLTFNDIPQQPERHRRGSREDRRKSRLEAHVTVRAIDPGATIRLTRLSGQRETLNARPDVTMSIQPGLWRVEVLIGDDVIAVADEDFAADTHCEVQTVAQVTPALAALMDSSGTTQPHAPTTSLSPSEAIGAMQGAILPTLLPLLALKTFDRNSAILKHFPPAQSIPSMEQQTDAPAAVAVALEGPWNTRDRMQVADGISVLAGGTANLLWKDPQNRIFLFANNTLRNGAEVRINLPGITSLDIAAPRLPGYCATVTATVWPDRPADASVNLFKLPPGSDQHVRPGRLARALAIAARIYRAGSTLDDVNYDVFSMISYGSWGDPVLGVLAWYGRWKKLGRGHVSPEAIVDFNARQTGVLIFLTNVVPTLTDTRIIAALALGQADVCNEQLDTLLADPLLEPPVLAESVATLARRALATQRLDHWSVMRFQLLRTAVFNAIQTDRGQ